MTQLANKRTGAKALFQAGDRPTDVNFADFFDSIVFLGDSNTNVLAGVTTITGDVTLADSTHLLLTNARFVANEKVMINKANGAETHNKPLQVYGESTYGANTSIVFISASVSDISLEGVSGTDTSSIKLKDTTAYARFGTYEAKGFLEIQDNIILTYSTGSNTGDNIIYMSGSLGVGFEAPDQKLHVKDADNAVYIHLETDADNVAGVIFENDAQLYHIGVDASNQFFVKDQSNSKTPFIIESNAANNTLVIDSAGKVGIGTATPSQALEVKGNIAITDGTFTQMTIYFEDDPSTGPDIQFAGHSFLSAEGNFYLSIDSDNSGTDAKFSIVNNSPSSSNANEIFKVTEAGQVSASSFVGDGSGLTGITTFTGFAAGDLTENNMLTVNPAGDGLIGEASLIYDGTKMGIGTTNPTETLTVAGNISASGDLFIHDDIFAPNIGTGTDNSVVVLDSDGSFKTDEINSDVWITSKNFVDANTISNGYITKATDSDTIASSILYESSNKIGLGTTTPTSSMHIFVDNTNKMTTKDGSILIVEQDNANGDAGIQFDLTGGQKWSIGIDHSDGDKFKIFDITDQRSVLEADGGGSLIQPGGDYYGRSVDGEYSRLFRWGGVYFTWDSDSYGNNYQHSITSTNGNESSFTDSITLNSYGNVLINIDSNNNSDNNTFKIANNSTDTNNLLLTVNEGGDLDVSGNITGSNIKVEGTLDANNLSLDALTMEGNILMSHSKGIEWSDPAGSYGDWAGIRMLVGNNGDNVSPASASDSYLEFYTKDNASEGFVFTQEQHYDEHYYTRMSVNSSGASFPMVAGANGKSRQGTSSIAIGGYLEGSDVTFTEHASNGGRPALAIKSHFQGVSPFSLFQEAEEVEYSINGNQGGGIRLIDNDTNHYWDIAYINNWLVWSWRDQSDTYAEVQMAAYPDSVEENVAFTGQHPCRPLISGSFHDKIGYIVSAYGTYDNGKFSTDVFNLNGPNINESLPQIILSETPKDKRVFGVISRAEASNSPRYVTHGKMRSYLNKPLAKDDERVWINSIGEGAIIVSNYSGSLENGDYITTSPITGIGMKQDDDLLHNYTVAKITQDENFSSETTDIVYNGQTYKFKLVGCTYHCG